MVERQPSLHMNGELVMFFIAVYEHTTEPTAVKVKCSIAMGLRKKKCSAFLLLVSIFMDRQQLAWFHYMPSICKMLSMFAVHKFV